MKRFGFLFLLCFVAFSCSHENWETGPDGITLYPEQISEGSAKAVRITPLGDGIIKVSASPEKEFSDDSSLVVLPGLPFSKFDLRESGDTLFISTSDLWIEALKSTGQIRFLDRSGKQLLKEKQINAKRFEPIAFDNVKGYSLRQVFESPPDEGLYGLGQHQAGEINYKGRNEELFQYNTKVSVPFIVSTENYGVLWDNYAFSRFGDPRPYGQIDQFRLFDMTGQEGGLTAIYIDDTVNHHLYTERIETTIDYENLTTIRNFPEGFSFSKAMVKWDGYLQPEDTGEFNFLLYYAGYTRIWIDDTLYAERWRTSWNPSVAKFGVKMNQGQKYHLRLEWIPDGGVSYIGLKVLSPAGPAEEDQISFWSEMGDQIDYYFIKGNSIDGVIRNYRELTGKAQVMPLWAMGFWQSRERYKTQEELLNTLSEFRKRHIPIDNIVQDWFYWEVDKWGSHEFDNSRFPDPEGMVKAVHNQNARIMISVWPKFYITTGHYKEFSDRGWMYRQAVNDSIRDWVWPGYIGSFYDAYNPGARRLFWSQMEEHLFPKGFDAWWMDATEPDIQSNADMDYRKQLMNPTALGPAAKYFNTYALMNAKAIYEGQREADPGRRVFILTRSGFAGMQKYGAATWSGDIGTCWEDMQSQITAGINFSMSGLPYWTMDIGGFSVQRKFEQAKEGSGELEEWRELNNRWFQFGAFVPLFRSHGQYPFREIFHLAPENHQAYSSMLYYAKLRYRLMPYIYSLAGAVYHQGYTIMRGLAMDFPEDKDIRNIPDQYMFGPSLMVCPVCKYKARQREVCFPDMIEWYDLYSGTHFSGGQTLNAPAPYNRMPLFVPEGSIIPVGPETEYTGQKKDAPLDIWIFTGKDGDFDLYEDEGSNYDYEKGAFSTIRFSWSETKQELTVHDRQGEFEGMVRKREFRMVFVSKEKPQPFLSEKIQFIPVKYRGEKITVKNK